ncbi:FtsX-like permease family protein [Streptacidiphilus sp. N1-10]|uniref:FtsX-like permease family protein n=1 Tax=Streptacidiphilus jeojiensis TaxID=3229225 RepID=A0ABV6XFU9_9ACTN
MFRTALRNVLAHRGRLLMTTLAVLLGTGFMTGTMIFSDSIHQAANNSRSKDFTGISVQVADDTAGLPSSARQNSTKSSARLTEATVRRIAALPGVAGTRAEVSGTAAIADKNGNMIGDIMRSTGANFVPDAAGNDARYPMLQGRGPHTATEVALDRGTVEKAGYRLGDTVRIAANGPAISVTLTGVFSSDAPAVRSGNPLALLDTQGARRVLSLAPDQYSSIDVTAAPGTSETALLHAVTPLVPGGNQFRVETGAQLAAQQAERLAQSGRSLATMLTTAAGISLFIGIFLIANTFTMLVAQRTRQLALLRAIGAGRSQVTRSVLIEALLVGLSGSAAGLLLGIGIGAALAAGVKSLDADLPRAGVVITPTTVLITLLVGTLVTVLSAALPALRACRIPPVAALSSSEQPATHRSLFLRNVLGSLTTAGGLGLVLLGSTERGATARLPLMAGALLAVLGIVQLLPLLSRPVIALARPPLARLCGTPGSLAALNAIRNPRRTASTAAALTIGLTLVTAMTVIGASVSDAIDRAVTQEMTADYVVTTLTGTLDPSIATSVAQAPGVVASSPVTDVEWLIAGERTEAKGLDADSADQLVRPNMSQGAATALKRGQILVDSGFASRHGLAVGSTVTVAAPHGTGIRLTVGGVFAPSRMLAPVLLPGGVVAAHQPYAPAQQILVKGANGATPAFKQALKDATGRSPVVEVENKQNLRDGFDRTITFALNLLYALLGMSLLVAALGVVNTLAMAVFERRRELGLLRAIGLDRGGVKRMIRLESVLISVFGAAIGMAFGAFLAWAAGTTMTVTLPELRTVLPYPKLLLMLLAAVLVGLAAAQWPARRAARLDVLDSITAD